MMVGGLKAFGLGTCSCIQTCATLHNASGQTQVKKQESYAQLGECKACSGMMLWMLSSSTIKPYSAIWQYPIFVLIAGGCQGEVPRFVWNLRLETKHISNLEDMISRFQNEVLYS